MLEYLKKAEIVSLDFETGVEKTEDTNLIQMDKVELFSVAVRVGKKYYSEAFGDERFKEIWNIIKNKRIVFHNAKFDLKVLKRKNINIERVKYEDTLIMAYITDETRRKGLKELRVSVLGLPQRDGYLETVAKNNIKEFKKYAKEDAEDTLKLFYEFMPLIEEEGLQTVYELERRVVLTVIEMEDNGAKVDLKLAAEQEQDLRQRIVDIEKDIEKIIKFKINLNSSKQVGDLFFRILKYPPLEEWRGKSGAFSVGASVLEYISRDRGKENKIAVKIATMMSDQRKYQKILTGFIEPMLRKNEDGIIHANFNQVLTVSGRFSSSGPNLQNIPTESWVGGNPFATVRALFNCNADEYFFSADYSQIELRMMAELSKDKNMCKAYINEIDIHDMTAKALKISRGDAKVVNFGIGYGMSAPRLSSFIKVSMGKAQELIDAYWGNYGGLFQFTKGLEKTAGDIGFIKSISGRKRRFKVYDQEAMRQTLNFVIQGSCADLMKMAMVRAYNLLDKKLCIMEMTVHDELCGRVKKHYAEEAMEIIKYSMESPIETYVPIVVKPKVGINWASVK